jgi:beta-lactamase regulating signal transducer with metallopeptidase domain
MRPYRYERIRSVLAALLFALKPLLRDRLPKAAQYYLWLAVIAALLVPVSRIVTLPAGDMSISAAVDRIVVSNEEIFESIEPYKVAGEDGFIGIPKENQPIVDELIPKPWYVELWDWCCIVRMLGSIGFFGYFLCICIAFTERLKRTNSPTGIDCPVPVCRNAKAATPMLIGLFNPVIVLPDREYTGEQLRFVLLHELTHLRRKDVLVKWLSILACAVH